MSSDETTGDEETTVEAIIRRRVHDFRTWVGGPEAEKTEKALVAAMPEEEHVRRAMNDTDIPPNVNVRALKRYKAFLPWARLEYRPDPQDSFLVVPDAALTGAAVVITVIDGRLQVLTVPRKDVLIDSDERPLVEGLPAGFVDQAYLAECVAQFTPQFCPAGPVRPENPAETALRETGEEVFGDDPRQVEEFLAIAGADGRGTPAMNTLVHSGTYDPSGRDPRTRKPGHEYFGTRMRTQAFVAVLTAEKARELRANIRQGAGTDAAAHFVPVEDILTGKIATWSDTRRITADGIPIALKTVEAERDARDVTQSELDAIHAEIAKFTPLALQISTREARLDGKSVEPAPPATPGRDAQLDEQRKTPRLNGVGHPPTARPEPIEPPPLGATSTSVLTRDERTAATVPDFDNPPLTTHVGNDANEVDMTKEPGDPHTDFELGP